jgi:cell division protein FtsQ
MKPKTPGFYSSMNASLGSERDVLLDTPPREPRVRTSIIGEKKLTARDAFERRNTLGQEAARSETLGRETAQHENKTRVKKRELSEVTQPNTKAVNDRTANDRTVKDKTASVETFSHSTADKAVHRADKNFRRERGYRKVSPQSGIDAKQEAVLSKGSQKLLYRGLGLLLLLTLAGFIYFFGKPVTKLLERPLKSVAVEGQFQYLAKDRAMELIMAEIDGNFLQLKLNRLKAVLEADPWVEHVFLSRRWPDTLVVKIAEQQPIARWGIDGFLNQRGEIIRIKEANKLLGLPWLQGNEINAREIMQQYQDLSTLLRARGLEIITLKCDNKKSWRITLKNDVEIAIGRDQVMEKMRRFVTVYDNFLSSVWRDVEAIDVRYTNGASVRWVPESAMAKKYLKMDSSVKPDALKANAL